MTELPISAIAAVASLIGAVVGCGAAFIAYREAQAAKVASNRSAELEKLALLRELSGKANEIVAVTLRIDGVANRCKQELRSLGVFSGGTGGSRETLHLSAIEEKQRKIGPLQNRAREVADSIADYKEQPEENINAVQSELDNFLIQSNRVLDELQEELSSYEGQNRTHRENAIRNT